MTTTLETVRFERPERIHLVRGPVPFVAGEALTLGIPTHPTSRVLRDVLGLT